jgi:hypothetical protein
MNLYDNLFNSLIQQNQQAERFSKSLDNLEISLVESGYSPEMANQAVTKMFKNFMPGVSDDNS